MPCLRRKRRRRRGRRGGRIRDRDPKCILSLGVFRAKGFGIRVQGLGFQGLASKTITLACVTRLGSTVLITLAMVVVVPTPERENAKQKKKTLETASWVRNASSATTPNL